MKNNTKLIMENWRNFLKESDDLLLDDEDLERDDYQSDFQDDIENLEDNLGNNESENVDLSQWETFISRYRHDHKLLSEIEFHLKTIWQDCWNELDERGIDDDMKSKECDARINDLINNHDASFIKNYANKEYDLSNDGFESEYREDGGESGYGYDYDHTGPGPDQPTDSGIEFMNRFKR